MIIENEKVRLEVVEHGGEIQSFYDLTHQLEYMWQGDAAFWSGKNPSLFPMVMIVRLKKVKRDSLK